MTGRAERRHLVLAGLGHVHMQLLARHHTALVDWFRISVITPHDGITIMDALATLAGRIPATRLRRYRVPEHIACRSARVLACQPVHQRLWLADGTHQRYDVASLNTGAARWPAWAEDTRDTAVPAGWAGHSAIDLVRLARALAGNEAAPAVVVAGGTKQSIAIAHALALRRSPALRCTLFWPVTDMPASERGALKRLARLGVIVVTGTTVAERAPGRIGTVDGRRFAADHVVHAGPATPSRLAQTLTTSVDDTGLCVDRRLQLGSHSATFAVGALAHLAGGQPLIASDAARQADVLACNLAALFDSRARRRYRMPRRAPAPSPTGDASRVGGVCRRWLGSASQWERLWAKD